MRTKPQRLCRKNRVTRIHEKRRIETCCRDADSQGQAVNAKKYHRDSIIFRGQAAFCSFSRAQSATDEALVDAFCFSGATLPNPNATTRIVRQQLNRWVVNVSALHVGPRKIFWRD